MTAVSKNPRPAPSASAKPPPASDADPHNPIHNMFWMRHRSEVEEDLRQLRAQPLTFFPV